MANVFKRGKMISGVVDSYLANAIAAVEVPDGALVTLGDLVADTTYDANGVEYDTYVAAAPAAATDEVVIVDYAGISEGEIAGNEYKMGIKLYGLKVPAGQIMRVRRLGLHDKFWLGEDNFASDPTVGQFAKATASAFTHTPAAALPESGYAIKVLAKEGLTTGMRANGDIYLCEVVQL
ncbi:MAG: hypothetical protein J6S67_07525 [Methanobrevibacter sp.]|nr:hypothetical protein [Methanobrevibacter sp.]